MLRSYLRIPCATTVSCASSSSSMMMLMKSQQQQLSLCTTATTAISTMLTSHRNFNVSVRTSDEHGSLSRLKNISPIVGQPKPILKEGEWELQFYLTDKMEGVIDKLLRDENWSDPEIKREIQNFNSARYGHTKQGGDRRQNWNTVEDFQRTPWYRRWRPNESTSAPMVSYEAMKILEKNLIAPSARADPYAHLRKRHYEDTFHSEKYSEGYVKNVSREQLKKYTPGMKEYGHRTRKEFLEFEKEYKKRNPDAFINQHEIYNAWKSSQR